MFRFDQRLAATGFHPRDSRFTTELLRFAANSWNFFQHGRRPDWFHNVNLNSTFCSPSHFRSQTECIFTFAVGLCSFFGLNLDLRSLSPLKRINAKRKSSTQSETVLSSERREDLSKWVEETAERGFVACKSSAWKPSHPLRLSENLVPGAEIRWRNRVLASGGGGGKHTQPLQKWRACRPLISFFFFTAKSPAERVRRWEEGRDPSGEGGIRETKRSWL